MYRYKDCKYNKLKTKYETKQLYLALPKGIDMLKRSFKAFLGRLFDK